MVIKSGENGNVLNAAVPILICQSLDQKAERSPRRGVRREYRSSSVVLALG
jgi:hypothetical protein